MNMPEHTCLLQTLCIKLLLFTLFFLFFFSTSFFGQKLDKVPDYFSLEMQDALSLVLHEKKSNGEIEIRDIGSNTLLEFKAKQIGGKAYTQWQVRGENENGLFIIERTVNCEDYELIGFRKGIGVLTETPLLYSWIDKNPIAGNSWYRLLKIYKDGRYYYSDPVIASTTQLIEPVSK